MPQTAVSTRAHARTSDPRAVVPTHGRSGRVAASTAPVSGKRNSRRGRAGNAAVGSGSSSRRAPSRARTNRNLESRCRSVFTTAVVLLVACASLGLARVAVIARAAEMTIDADTLAKRIQEERVQADQLEVDRSSLSAPSRIEALAADTMSMGDPASVSYITLPRGVHEGSGVTGSDVGSAVAPVGEPSGDRFAGVISALLDVSAGEAQSLLVGDLGLAGSR